MISAEMKGNLLPVEKEFLKDIAAKTAAKTAAEFADYLKNRKFEELFKNQTGETLGSVGLYRAKGTNPVYKVRAGVGVPGSLNYLAGLYGGSARSRLGKIFSYSKPRPLIRGGKKEFDVEKRLSENGGKIAGRVLSDLEAEKNGR